MADSSRQREGDATRTRAESPQTTTRTAPDRGRRRRVGGGRDLTTGSIPANLWYMAWPQIAESFLSVVDQLLDVYWAAKVALEALAGLGIGQTFLMMLMTARMGLDAGMRSMISRAVGARQMDYANHVMLQSITLTMAYSVALVAVGMIFTDPLLRLFGLSDEVVRQAGGYMRFQFVAMSVMGLQRLTAGALQAAGDPVTPLKAAFVSRVGHLILSPFLIFGWLWFPALDLAGAGAANLVAQTLGAGWNTVALIRGRSGLRLTMRGYYVDFELIWRLLKIGIPASVTGAQRAVSQLIVVFLVVPFGDGALAAFALSRRAENTVNHASRGLGRAAGALAGQNLGAGHTDRARSSLLWAVGYAGAASLLVAALFFAFSEQVATFFNSDAEFVAQAALWLQILAVGYFSMNAVQVFTQGFNTTGATFAPMVIMVSTMWLVEIPLAFALSQYTGLAEYGVPWAIVIGMTIRAAAFAIYFVQGKWLRTGMM